VETSRARFLAAATAVAAGTARPRTVSAQTPKLRIGCTLSEPFAEAFFAKEAGTFARAGFDVEPNPLVNAGAIVAAVGGGSLDLGIGDLVSGVKAIDAGVPVTLIAGSALSLSSIGGTILAVAKDGPIRSARDLIGKVVAVPTLVGLSTAALRAWLPLNGVDSAGVKFIELPASAMVPSLQRGVTDAVILGEPFVTASRNDIRDIGHPYDAIGKEFLLSVWYAQRSWIEADRDRARRVVAAIYETARWANAHHAETLAVLVRDARLDAEKLGGMSRVSFATSLTKALVQPVLNIATQYKIFDKSIDANAIIARI
jgi:NitT/TauT family transport system substrate-binding protein